MLAGDFRYKNALHQNYIGIFKKEHKSNFKPVWIKE